MLGATALVPLGLADDQHDLGYVSSNIVLAVHLSSKLICYCWFSFYVAYFLQILKLSGTAATTVNHSIKNIIVSKVNLCKTCQNC